MARAAGVRWPPDSVLGSAAEFTARLQRLLEEACSFSSRFRPLLADSKENDLPASYSKALTAWDALLEEGFLLETYLTLRELADCDDEEAADLRAQMDTAGVSFEEETRFLILSWLELPDAVADTVLAASELEDARGWLRAERRFRPFSLSEREEQVLAAREQAAQSSWQQLQQETVARTNVLFDSGDGERLRTLDELRSLALHHSRELRQRALEANFAALEPQLDLLAHCYDTLVADRLAVDRLRGLSDPMLAAHLANDLEPAVVDGLLATVEEHYHLVRRWYRLKARLLGVERLDYFDLNAPLGSPPPVSYQQATTLLTRALADFDPELAAQAQRLFESGRVDAEPRPNKAAGAFCLGGVAATGSYLLLNYSDFAHDAGMLAHETGHALHAELSLAAQPFYRAEPGVSLAEVAASFSESLFEEQLQSKAVAAERLLLLGAQIERCFAAIFRQTTLTVFERRAYTLRSQGKSLTAERLTALWLEESGRCFGDSVSLPDFYGYGWSYVPQLYGSRFYNYSYAFANLVALALLSRRAEPGFAAGYRRFLAAGSSVPPAEALRTLGVAINDAQIWSEGFAVIASAISEAEGLAATAALPLARD